MFHTKSKSAFTMIEMVFVIVILGILAAVAIPRLSATRTDAVISKARADISSIRSAIMTERQTRLIKGMSSFIPTGTGTYVGTDGNTYNQMDRNGLFGGVLTYPITDSATDGHWTQTARDVNTTTYQFRVGTSVNTFKYAVSNGTFTCTSGSECTHLTH